MTLLRTTIPLLLAASAAATSLALAAPGGPATDPEAAPARVRAGTHVLPRYAFSASRENARIACTDRAAAGLLLAPRHIDAGDARAVGDGFLAVDLATPRGSFRCIADRDGHVRTIARW